MKSESNDSLNLFYEYNFEKCVAYIKMMGSHFYCLFSLKIVIKFVIYCVIYYNAII